MTTEADVEVSNKQGIHARPSSMIVKTAMEFRAEVVIRNEATGFEANARSPLEVMMLNAPCGTQLVLSAEGDDAEEALAAIIGLITSGFDED